MVHGGRTLGEEEAEPVVDGSPVNLSSDVPLSSMAGPSNDYVDKLGSAANTLLRAKGVFSAERKERSE